MEDEMPTAVITGASKGLGFELARELSARGWDLVLDARDGAVLERAARSFPGTGRATVIPGDVADPAHRAELAAAVGQEGLDLLVNNASTLGPTPMPGLADYPLDRFESVFRVNTFAPLAFMQLLREKLSRAEGVVVNLSSDASVEAYAGWGGYGASKAALDHLSAIFAAEHPALSVYALDPGDMRTAMQQDAFPGEDISDRPPPATVVPALLQLLEQLPPSGRYRASELLAAAGTLG
jgi:NAD(P)-dependent dehydrogenase (short-subunit alcohol dehydrogenase family)